MASFMKELERLEIKLEDIKSATNYFNENKVIGKGGFGKVYKGELSHSEGKSMVAIKRLDRKYGQGDTEFLKEIRMLSCLKHKNIISLLGFCMEGDEMILVYEHASCGSLDRILNDANLTWKQRLNICLDAAKGLTFLHDPNGTQQIVLHRDIKSANILLDENLNAKVADFGLSKISPANQKYSFLFTAAVGTPGYCDPLYMDKYQLTKESDVYSFGVVLFEVLCGRVCYEHSDGNFKIFVHFWKRCYEQKKLDEIIFPDLKQQMDPRSVKTFVDIAYQCLQKTCEQRPTMSVVVEKLKAALESKELHDLKLKREYEQEEMRKAAEEMRKAEEYEQEEMRKAAKYEAEEIRKALGYECGEIIREADPPLIYKSIKELEALLLKGFPVNVGKTPKSCSRAMKAVGVVEASCGEIFELVMRMDVTRYEWDCSFQDGSVVDNVDGHTTILYHRLCLDWFPRFVWPRDLCYVRYWRRNDDGSYIVLFHSTEDENCGPQPGHVRAHIEDGGFIIFPLKPRNGRPRSLVQHLMQIDLKGWGVGYVSSFQQHCLLKMLNSVAGLREYFAQTDESIAPPLRIPAMVNMASSFVSTKKSQKIQLNSVHNRSQSLDNAAKMMDEYSDEDEDFQISDEEAYKAEKETKRVAFEE